MQQGGVRADGSLEDDSGGRKEAENTVDDSQADDSEAELEAALCRELGSRKRQR